jgi:hypothetical protein
VHSRSWKKDAKKIIPILTSNYPKFLKNILLHPFFGYFKILFFPIFLLLKLIGLLIPKSEDTDILKEDGEKEEATEDKVEINTKFLDKLSSE